MKTLRLLFCFLWLPYLVYSVLFNDKNGWTIKIFKMKILRTVWFKVYDYKIYDYNIG